MKESDDIFEKETRPPFVLFMEGGRVIVSKWRC